MTDHRDRRQQDGAHGIYVLDRIQCDAAQHARRRIAAAIRHPRVRGLVHADREQKGDDLKQDLYDIQIHAGTSMVSRHIDGSRGRLPHVIRHEVAFSALLAHAM